MYNILKYSFNRALLYGVKIQPSKKKNKKIDVLYNGDVIASVGDIKYYDYPHYIKSHGLEYANLRRDAYHKRHYKDISNIGSPGWWASVLLW